MKYNRNRSPDTLECYITKSNYEPIDVPIYTVLHIFSRTTTTTNRKERVVWACFEGSAEHCASQGLPPVLSALRTSPKVNQVGIHKWLTDVSG